MCGHGGLGNKWWDRLVQLILAPQEVFFYNGNSKNGEIIREGDFSSDFEC